jgi:hypothetical protein
MPKTLLKGNNPKIRAALSNKNKPESDNKKSNGAIYLSSKKNTGKLIHILNYQYQDSDLEQFVF